MAENKSQDVMDRPIYHPEPKSVFDKLYQDFLRSGRLVGNIAPDGSVNLSQPSVAEVVSRQMAKAKSGRVVPDLGI